MEKRASSVNLDIVLPNLVPRVFESYLVIRKHPMAFTTKEIVIPNSKHCKNDRNLNLKETVLAGWQFILYQVLKSGKSETFLSKLNFSCYNIHELMA
jgi:hypothetical protein